MTELGKSLVEEGKKEEKIQVAHKAIAKGFDDETIHDLTGLTIEQIQKLRKALGV